jgi:hypothetical protein
MPGALEAKVCRSTRVRSLAAGVPQSSKPRRLWRDGMGNRVQLDACSVEPCSASYGRNFLGATCPTQSLTLRRRDDWWRARFCKRIRLDPAGEIVR